MIAKFEEGMKKIKIIVLRKRGRRNKESVWKWEHREIEKVRKFRYLGFYFNSVNSVSTHLKNVCKSLVMWMVWGILEEKNLVIFGREVSC